MDNVVYTQVYLTDIEQVWRDESSIRRVLRQKLRRLEPCWELLAFPIPPIQINAVAVRNLDGRKAIYPPDLFK